VHRLKEAARRAEKSPGDDAPGRELPSTFRTYGTYETSGVSEIEETYGDCRGLRDLRDFEAFGNPRKCMKP